MKVGKTCRFDLVTLKGYLNVRLCFRSVCFVLGFSYCNIFDLVVSL